MAKKQHERSEVEHLKGIIRAQKSEIRNLKKELGRMRKRKDQLEDHFEEEAEEALQEIAKDYADATDSKRCPKCSSTLDIVDLGIREMHTCLSCDYRQTFKKADKK